MPTAYCLLPTKKPQKKNNSLNFQLLNLSTLNFQTNYSLLSISLQSIIISINKINQSISLLFAKNVLNLSIQPTTLKIFSYKEESKLARSKPKRHLLETYFYFQGEPWSILIAIIE